MSLFPQIVGLPKCLDHLCRKRFGLLGGFDGGRREVFHHHHKFIPPEPRQSVDRSECFSEPSCDLQQKPVAHVVAQRIVQHLEVVEIDKKDGAPFFVSIGGDDGQIDPLVEKPSVGEGRQRIIVGQRSDRLLFGAAAPVDFGDQDHGLLHEGVVHGEDRAGEDRRPVELPLGDLHGLARCGSRLQGLEGQGHFPVELKNVVGQPVDEIDDDL